MISTFSLSISSLQVYLQVNIEAMNLKRELFCYDCSFTQIHSLSCNCAMSEDSELTGPNGEITERQVGTIFWPLAHCPIIMFRGQPLAHCPITMFRSWPLLAYYPITMFRSWPLAHSHYNVQGPASSCILSHYNVQGPAPSCILSHYNVQELASCILSH